MDEVYVTPNADADDKIRNAFGCFSTKDDTTSRQVATQTALDFIVEYLGGAFDEDFQKKLMEQMNALPSAQPDYQEVLGWLLAYHTMSFDLHGRYLPHEVISWLINDFTKNFMAERQQNE